MNRPWAYSAFRVQVRSRVLLSPRFLRLTLAGDELRNFAPWGLDQRIKVVLPFADGTIADFGLLDDPTPHPSDWYSRWRALPEAERNVLRTYTPAAIRPEVGEIDVDFFLHEPAGPASAWAAAAQSGDRLVVNGPDIRMGHTGYGIHWNPGDARRFLLVADETAYPAVRNIVGTLGPDVDVDVILEASDLDDEILSRELPAHVRVRVVRRDVGVEAAVREWGASFAGGPDFSAWLAGESGTTTSVRRYLTDELTVPKEQVSFLGYWKLGGPLVG